MSSMKMKKTILHDAGGVNRKLIPELYIGMPFKSCVPVW